MFKKYSNSILVAFILLINSLILIQSISVQNTPTNDELKQIWNSFKTNHSLQFDEVEEVNRFEVYKENYLKVLEHNNDFLLQKKPFKLQMNQFSYLTHDEYMKRHVNLNYLDTPDSSGSALNRTLNITKILNAEQPTIQMDYKTSLPASFDWRSFKMVNPPRHQSQCGSCWAFATTSAVETIYARKYGKLLKFSDQELVDCTTENWGCNGGWPHNGFYHANKVGLVKETTYPYTGRSQSCLKNQRSQRFKIKGYGKVPFGDEKALKRIVATYGPVAVAIDGSDYNFAYYSGGIYYSTTCTTYVSNHAVLVVGYGTENGFDYWIVKNSWGTGWGLVN